MPTVSSIKDALGRASGGLHENDVLKATLLTESFQQSTTTTRTPFSISFTHHPPLFRYPVSSTTIYNTAGHILKNTTTYQHFYNISAWNNTANININATLGNSNSTVTSLEDLYEGINLAGNGTGFNGTAFNGSVDGVFGNGTRLGEDEPLVDLIFMGVLSVLLGLMILVTIIGNVFVIAAILLERNLQNVANYLIVSLAVADLMVACLVMPLGAVYVISNNWIMGPEICDMWTTIDVMCCTASILHLVAIAMDRYWAVTNVVYTRNSHRIGIMIIMIWSVALVVSLAPQIPQFGWKDPENLNRIEKKQCLVSQDVGYQIFATSSTFYVPLLVIFILYWKIFQTARKRIRKRREMRQHNLETSVSSNEAQRRKKNNNFLAKKRFLKMKKCAHKKRTAAETLVASLVMVEGQSTTTMDVVEETDEQVSNGNTVVEETTAFTITDATGNSKNPTTVSSVSNNVSPEKSSHATTNNGSASHQSHMSDISRVELTIKEPICPASVDRLLPSKSRKETLEAKRERKAAKTLAIITGAFVMCWVPFFILAVVMPVCGEKCNISGHVMNFSLWLGYFNSTLNPVIYTIFNPEFRQAFKRILCGVHGRNRAANRNFRSVR